MTRTKPLTWLATAAVLPLAALAVAGAAAAPATTTTQPLRPRPRRARPTLRTRALRRRRWSASPRRASARARRLARPHPVSVHEGLGDEERVLWRVRQCLAAAAGERKPTAGRRQGFAGGDDQALGRKLQVTYNGHPLYSFVKDTKSGDTNGEGLTAFGGSWFAVSPAGKRIANQPSRSGGGSSSSRPAAPAAPPAPKKAPQPAAPAAPKSSPAPKKPPSASNSIPQNNGGDQDSDNNGGPDDGDGGI